MAEAIMFPKDDLETYLRDTIGLSDDQIRDTFDQGESVEEADYALLRSTYVADPPINISRDAHTEVNLINRSNNYNTPDCFLRIQGAVDIEINIYVKIPPRLG